MSLNQKIITCTLLSAFAFNSAYAETTTKHDSHANHKMDTIQVETQSDLGYAAANKKMHENMSITFSGDADIDFIKGMIPHHQGAIDMAGVVLKYGKNPKIRQLAQEIITAQTKEIGQRQEWLKEIEASK